MAEMQLSEQQMGQVESLVTAIGQDAALRERFQADPRAVLGEYGLADLVPSDVDLEVSVGQPEVGGFARNTGHWDIRHADTHADLGGGGGHIDFAHTDVAALRSGGPLIGITPVIGRASR